MVKKVKSSWNFFQLPRLLLVAAIALSFVSLTACNKGPRLVKVGGSVQVDGQPAGGVVLLFFDAESSVAVASARTDSDGSFTPTTEMNPGMPEGRYRVAATWPDPNFRAPAASMGATPPDPPDLLSGRYGLKNTDVMMDVSSSSPKVLIELKTK